MAKQKPEGAQAEVPATPPVAAKRITKVKLAKRVEIDVVEVSGPEQAQTEATTAIRSKHRPHPDLVEALTALRQPVGALLELTPKYLAEGFTVVSVHLSSQKGGARGLVVNATKALKGSKRPLNLSTPLLVEEEGEHEELFELIDTVCAEAFGYLDGKRAQLELFTKEERAPGNPVGETEELAEPVGAAQ